MQLPKVNKICPLVVVAFASLSLALGIMDLYRMGRTWKSPVVYGRVVNRTRYHAMGVPKIDLVIQLEGETNIIHAGVQRHLENKVPDHVRFRYSGSPSESVFLLDFESNPLWQVLFSGAAIPILYWKFLRDEHADKVKPFNDSGVDR